MHRERIQFLPRKVSGDENPPLLFVHGAFATGQCWAAHVMPACADAGWHTHAFSLRGHGASAGDALEDNYGLDAYLDDLVDEIDRLDQVPVLVGHSMGGWLAMRAATECLVAGLVLMCPVPPFGLASANMSLAIWNPLLAARIGWVFATGGAWLDPDLVRATLFAGALPSSRVAHDWAEQTGESLRAGIEMQQPPRFDLSPLRTIARLVIGSEHDALVPPQFVQATAELLDTSAEILPGLGHALMLEQEGVPVVERLLNWLNNADFGISRRAA